MDSLEAPTKKRAPEPKWCGTCEHQYEYVVTWDDLPPEQGGTAEGEDREHDE